ncbi:MAG: phosphoenolpyruvate carboxykinase (GTP), partial [Acidobacteria bacterium]
GLDLTPANIERLLEVDREGWRRELDDIAAHYQRLGDRLPKPLWEELEKMRSRLDG